MLILLLMAVLPILLAAQGIEGDVGILYTLANGELTQDSGGTWFEFDVMAQGISDTQKQTRLGTCFVSLQYSSAFGTEVCPGNGVPTGENVEVTKGTLIQDLVIPGYPPIQFYWLIANNSMTDVFSVTTEFLQDEGSGTILPYNATQFFHVKLRIRNPEDDIWVCLYPRYMSGENFYDDEWTWYSPVEIGNCIYYDPPLPVELSTFTASMNITNDAVNLMWVTQTETNMIGYRILRGNSDVLAEAEDQNTLIPATNTSQPVSYMYSDTVIQPEQSYYYWLEALDMDGTNTFFGPIAITVPGEGEYTPAIPLATGISSLYPNPFNPDLTISYSVKTSLPVKIDIVNMRGQIIQTLVNENKEAGVYRQNWNGTGSDGRLCSSGVYFVRMQAGGEEYYAKAILLK